MQNLIYEQISGQRLEPNCKQFHDCANLFSRHYGEWSDNHPDPEKRNKGIYLSADKIAEHFRSKNSWLYTAKLGDKLIGYAIAVTFPDRELNRNITWITQLVVHSSFRHGGIATQLLREVAKNVSGTWAIGLVSASPYAVRALESATGYRCNPLEMRKHFCKLCQLALEHVPYIKTNQECYFSEYTARINTEFFVDRSATWFMREQVSKETPWALGGLTEGCEYFAFVFDVGRYDERQRV